MAETGHGIIVANSEALSVCHQSLYVGRDSRSDNDQTLCIA